MHFEITHDDGTTDKVDASTGHTFAIAHESDVVTYSLDGIKAVVLVVPRGSKSTASKPDTEKK